MKYSTVILQRGNDRYQNVRRALETIKTEIEKETEKRHPKNIILKPNFVSVDVQLAVTNVFAIKAVLDFLAKTTAKKIPKIIAEGTASGDTFSGFKNFGYLDKLKNYNVRFFDLNKDESETIEILDSKERPFLIKIAKILTNKNNFIISVTPLKTHDAVIATLSIKNILMGAPLQSGTIFDIVAGKIISPKLTRNYKALVHQGYQMLNINLARLSKYLWPNLSVIDGFEAMEGEGPTYGENVPMKIAIVSLDPLACDAVATHLMGFDLDNIGYLYYLKELKKGCADLSKIEILGNTDLKSNKRKFKFHRDIKRQLLWQKKSWQELI